MELNEYQDKAFTFRVASAPSSERLMGLFEEVGEFAGVNKRILRGDYTSREEIESKVYGELGDILWYLSQVAADYGFKLSDIAEENLRKLESRKNRGVLRGSGDNR